MSPVFGHSSHGDREGGCVMEWVSLLHTGHATLVDGIPALSGEWGEANAVKTDLPACTNLVVAYAAQRLNDRTPDDKRDEVAAEFLPRILRARRLAEPTEKRVNVRLAIWAARQVEDRVPDELREGWERTLNFAERWLLGEATEDECREAANRFRDERWAWYKAARAADADAAAAVADAAAVAVAADADAAAAVADAAAVAVAADADAAVADAAADAAAAAVWLDRLLDAHQKAVAEEGAWADLIELWEQDACAFAEGLA